MPRTRNSAWRNTYQDDNCLIRPIRMLGWTSVLNAHPGKLGPHTHDECWETCYIVRGRVDWWAGDQAYKVTGGHVYITRPDETHGGVDAALHPCEIYWLILKLPVRGALSGTTIKQTRRLIHALKTLRTRTYPVSQHVHDCFRRMLHEHRMPNADSELVCQTLLLQLLVQIARDHDAFVDGDRRHSEPTDPKVRNTIKQIDADLVGVPTLTALAKRVGLTSSALRQRFTQQTGLSPADYITLRRIDEAARLLRETKLTITQIAFKVGFSSSQYFATAFKRRTGMSPLNYRTNHKGD